MSDLVCVATGNLTAAATWGLCDAAKLVSTNIASTALTASPLDSATFIPAANALIGVCVKLAARATGAPTNTITITLRNSTTATDVASVTANVSDLPAATTGANTEGGWHFFKFSASHTPNGTDSYVIRAVLSATTTAVSLCTNGTANNWQRLLVTSTTQAPVAGDDMYIAQTLDGSTNPATVTARTVTMDSTAATDYGSAVASQYQSALNVSKACTLNYGTTAATNYVLRLSGTLCVFSGATFNIGSAGAEIPRDSTAILEFDCAAAGNFGLRILNGSTFSAQGLSRTVAKNVWMCKLSADEAVASTTIDVDTDTGWKNGDEVSIISTTRSNETELRTLNADAGATSFTISAGLTNAHLGSGDYFAEVFLLTRNVEIRAVNSSFQTFVISTASPTITLKWCRFRYWTSISGQSDFPIGSGGSLTIDYVVFRDYPFVFSFGSNVTNWTMDHTLLYNGTGSTSLLVQATTGTWAIRDVACAGGTHSFSLSDVGGTIGNLWSVGMQGSAINWNQAATLNSGSGGPTFVAASVWTIHSHYGGASTFMLGINATTQHLIFPTLKMWRNNGAPILLGSNIGLSDVEFTGDFFGNGSGGEEANMFRAAINNPINDIRFVNCNCSGDTLSTPNWGVLLDKNNVSAGELNFYNCKFSENTGTRRPLVVADIGLIPDIDSGGMFMSGIAEWCTFGAPEPIKFYYATGTAPQLASKYSYIICPGYGQSASAHRVYTPYGTIILDTTTFDVTPSQNIKPIAGTTLSVDSNAFRKGTGFLVPVNNGAAPTVSVKVQIDVAYNGATKPQLVLLKNRALGITSDTVIATHSGATGSWETLSGTPAAPAADGVYEFVVRCYGSAGNAWIDTWATGASAPDPTGDKYWNGQPVTFANTSGGGGGGNPYSAAYLG